MAIAPEDATSIEKKSKKDKKDKKKKSRSLPAETESIVPTETEQVVSANDDSKASKKKSKKRKHAEVDTEAVATERNDEMQVDAEPATEVSEKKKKKKKHSHEDQKDVSLDPTESSSDKKERKKKKKDKKQDVVMDAAAELSDAKAEKKEKKQKAKKSAENAGSSSSASASTPAEVSAFLTKNNITIHVPSSSSPVTPFLNFAQLPIPDPLRTFSAKFKEPSPVQSCTWPPALEGKDVIGIAETGSGKTLAFGVPALARLISSPPPPPSKSSPTITTLVVAPTRELAIQTHEALEGLGEQFGIASVAVFGGVPKEGQVKMLRNLHKANSKLVTRIIVGTPGRILDLMSEGACDLSGVEFLVLDEADRMLDKGFENDIRKIISSTKPQTERQTLMFSATWPDAVRKLASTFLNDPVRVTVGSDDLTANSRVEQVVEVFDDSRGKDAHLLRHLRALGHKKMSTDADSRILIFALYKAEASRVENMLRREGYAVGALHGDLSQNNRLQALEEFKSGKTGLLVATDVAARGLDIPNVGAVINYTFPLTIEDYIHRIGRTGRGGKSGKSITFFTGENQERGLAGELSRVLTDSGFSCPDLKKFPMTIKKKEHGSYGAFFRDDIVATRKKIVF
ncbi:DEAD-domain-containing protein [Gymnopus androsaceus JB14]|uniref:RNA helicase n=1 Tax=Gymnopus androsaceus JB14 TaxID=1447944 RepID=A0A6A4HKN8_9AGAR|nr:DEAD-domain-containing protein [Gymnopus androsaceus JB14]